MHRFYIKKKSLRRFAAVTAMFAVLFGLNLRFIPIASAATITSAKDVLSTLVDSANANHTISWVSPSAVATGSTIAITFPTGFDFTGVVIGDVDLDGSTEGSLTLAADCTGAENASYVRSGQLVTFTLCAGDNGNFTNSETITVKIGTNASGGANQINNQTEAQNNSDATIDITSGASDSGSVAVEIIADDSVSVTATVDPTLTFSISDTTIEFGTLSTGSVKYADDSNGNASVTPAHTFNLGTNAASGAVIKYSGALLTSAANDINAATISGDADGTPGSEQFAMSFDDNGSTFTITTAYDEASNNSKFDTTGAPNQDLTIVSSSGPVASTSIDAHYLANIASNTPAGIYSTSITYIATGTF